MTLATLIQKGGLARVATATPATPATPATSATSATSATHPQRPTRTVAAVATVAVASPQPDETARRWQIRYPKFGPIDVLFTPPASRAEVAEVYPGAELDTLSESNQRNATPAEATELRELVAIVLADADDADREEALTVALRDPQAALESFRLLAIQARDRALGTAK